jgi:hypothetical protein
MLPLHAQHASAPEPEYLDARAVAAVLGIPLAELRELAARGHFAPLLALTSRRALVHVADLDAWERRSIIAAGAKRTLRLTAEAHRWLARNPLPDLEQGPERPEGEDASRDVALLR